MQNSPQYIKIRLDRAVDPDGNVLDMAAVLEIVTTLEQIPVTKEALEKTRIGKTINQLRKKTNNVDLARRAKKLVKKWQKAFVNHIEAIRNADSPLNGSRVSSPQFNGSIRDSDSLPGTPTSSEGQEKLKSIEGKKRGLKRKRAGSSENSPFGKDLEGESKSRTESPTDGVNTPELVGISFENKQSQSDSQCSLSYSDVSLELSSSSATVHNVKNERLDTERKSAEEVSISKTENGDVPQQAQGSAGEAQNNSDSVNEASLLNFKNEENCDVSVPKPKQDNVCDGVKQSDTGNITTVEDSSVECKTELVGMDEDSPEPDVLPVRRPRSPSEMELEVTAQATGINGHFGPDGVWYNWTEKMPSSDGLLTILPYVLLE